MNKISTSWLIALFCLFAFQSFAQNGVLVTGTVRSAGNRETMPGVGVRVKNAQVNTLTDAMGKFSIRVPDLQATLVFTYVGVKTQEVPLAGRATAEVLLEDEVNELNEVVVVGYGEQSRSTVTNSISRVDAREFQNAPAANPLNQLQGKVAGLSLQVSSGQPGANPQIFIRGGASTSPEGDAPLFIVDGIVGAMRNISDINPDDIESMQVLKDAASTAIYGARAANGVIIIKTKSGKAGAKPSINFKYTSGLDRQGKSYDFTSAQDYVFISRLNTQKFNTSNPSLFLSGGTYGMSTGNARNTKNTLEFLDTYIAAYGKDYVSDLIDNQGWTTMTDPVTGKKMIFKETNYQDVTFQDAMRNEYDFNISGGTEKATYYASLGHLDQSGIVAGTDYKNYNFLLNATYKLSDSWDLNANVSYLLRQSKGIGNVQNVLSRSVTMPFTYRETYENGLPAPGEGVTSFRNRNHEIYYRDQYSDNKVYRTNLSMGATWNIIPGLTFKPAVYWFTTEGINNAFEAYNEVNINRNASSEHSFVRAAQVDGVFNYVKNFGDKHHTSTVLGSSYINNYNYVINASGYGAPTDNIKTVNATSILTQRSSTEITEDALMSFFGRVNYDYDSKYLFSASLRHDGSSKFAERNKFGWFPGVSAGWNVHREKFFEPISRYVSTLKVRSSYGEAGQNDLSLFDTRGQYSIGNTYLGEVGILNTRLANADLVWETTSSLDAGADIGLFKNRLTILVDWYDKKTRDRIFSKPLDATTGFSSITSNFGQIRTRGFEIEVSATPVRNKNFSWDVSANFSWNRSIALRLPDNGEIKNRIGGNIVYNKDLNAYVKVGGTAEGERYGGRWAYNMIGVYATDADAANAPKDVEANNRVKKGGDAIWEDVDGNGIIDSRDMVFMGFIRPDRMGGLVNTINYRGLSMRIVTDFALGHVIDNSFRGRAMASARNNNMTLQEVMGDKIWNNPGDQASIPKYTVQSDADYNYRNHLRNGNGLVSSSGYTTANSLYHSKGDFLAFREVSFSYALRGTFLKKAHIAGVNLFAGVFNLGYLTKYDGLMPEIYTGNDQGSYPRPRQYNFGATVTF
ncbi:SusC/RagA family TonB-linked outer membrane protein [Pedobacter yulinensis]|uniref:SusC/RagA family TonB-linked outer membrane protein n=1 Tax=Pedobacter yulinensis TaxID=2126353 RepID=A0A2T3HMD5_9SPHI|nr:SusC/RagA family TonB-linked outer membrane protein [Pedobacter yulinensis]PST83573.1 SusC/RagA family TonB-linked outer membrane protein [Pedobacter yulinensis]